MPAASLSIVHLSPEVRHMSLDEIDTRVHELKRNLFALSIKFGTKDPVSRTVVIVMAMKVLVWWRLRLRGKFSALCS